MGDLSLKTFLQVNRARLRWTALLCAGMPAILLLVLLQERTGSAGPEREPWYVVVGVPLALFLVLLAAFIMGGYEHFRKQRKILGRPNWSAFFEKQAFSPVQLSGTGFLFVVEGRQGRFGGFNVVVTLESGHKELQFRFLGHSLTKGAAQRNYQCNAVLAFTNLAMEGPEIEDSLRDFLGELEANGVAPSERTSIKF